MNPKNIFALIAAAVLLTGCATHYGNHWTEDGYQSLRKGLTKEAVTDLLGAPKQITKNNLQGETLVYDNVTAKTKICTWRNVLRLWTRRLTVILDSTGQVADFKRDELYSEELAPTTGVIISQPAHTYGYKPDYQAIQMSGRKY